jgi:membrane dipeptidase
MNPIPTFDGHCDVLYRLWHELDSEAFFQDPSPLDVSCSKLKQAGVKVQTFAIFVPPEVPPPQRFSVALKQIDLFYRHVLREDLRLIATREQLERLPEGRIGALLNLEGADAIQGDLVNLRTLYRLGVRQIGLTWNHANEVADGVGEPRNGGLTRFGRELLKEVQRLSVIVDVSHLSPRGFWDVMEFAELPVIASHSNAKSICDHRRNLDDEQIRALIERDGLIGITFVPGFVDSSKPSLQVLLKHIEHICELGGENHLFFGSDFDGITEKVPGLEDVSKYPSFYEFLSKYYSESLIRRWAWENAKRFYAKALPKTVKNMCEYIIIE